MSPAIGFRHTVHKLSTTVQLLLGNIPERNLFLQPANKEALASYFELTKGKQSIYIYLTISRFTYVRPHGVGVPITLQRFITHSLFMEIT